MELFIKRALYARESCAQHWMDREEIEGSPLLPSRRTRGETVIGDEFEDEKREVRRWRNVFVGRTWLKKRLVERFQDPKILRWTTPSLPKMSFGRLKALERPNSILLNKRRLWREYRMTVAAEENGFVFVRQLKQLEGESDPQVVEFCQEPQFKRNPFAYADMTVSDTLRHLWKQIRPKSWIGSDEAIFRTLDDDDEPDQPAYEDEEPVLGIEEEGLEKGHYVYPHDRDTFINEWGFEEAEDPLEQRLFGTRSRIPQHKKLLIRHCMSPPERPTKASRKIEQKRRKITSDLWSDD